MSLLTPRTVRRALTAAAIAIAVSSCGGSTTPAVSAPTTSRATATADSSTTTEAQSSAPSSVAPTTSLATAGGSSSSSTSAATSASTTTTAPVLASTVCTAAELPPAGNPFTPVMVSGITAVDPDKGLNIRFDPTTASAVQFALPNGSTFATTGLCEKSPDGMVWWAVEDGHWDGWASSAYLTPYVAGTSVCPADNYNPIGKGTVESILGDYDGNGSVDAMFLAYDGVVQPPNIWTGSTATLQIQFADGGLSTELDITPLIGDGGPGLGVAQMSTFPQRIDFAGSFISGAVLSSTFSGSATGAGYAHFAWASNCEPVISTMQVTPSAGNPQRPIICDIGGGGRVQLYALDGLSGSLDYLVTQYDMVGDQLIPQPQVVAGSANTDPDPTLC